MTPLPNNSAEGFCHSSHMDEDLIQDCSSSSSSHGSSVNLLNESDRLKTLNSWQCSYANKRAVAAAGFFYTKYENIGDLLKCPFCNLEIQASKWEEGADPFELHRRGAPQCAFMKRIRSRTTTDCSPSFNMQSVNDFERRRPSVSAEPEHKSLFQINTKYTPMFPDYASEEERRSTYASISWPSNFKTTPDSLTKAGFFYIGPATKTACFQCGGVILWEAHDDAFVEHEHFFPKCYFIQQHKLLEATSKLTQQILKVAECTPRRPEYNVSPLRTANLNLTLESDRLKTFNDWQYSYINKNELAAAGFYYTGKGDNVICYSCKVCVSNWEMGDDPAGEHIKHSPNCKMVPYCREILLKKTGSAEPIPDNDSNGIDTCGLYDTPNQRPPKYPRYLTAANRATSFSNWPAQFKIRPNTLWEAGFFYSGIDDHCICFQCGTGLKNWKENDDPWTEHALWYPECDYLVSVKGSAFVQDARRNRRDTMTLSEEEIKDAVEVLQSVFRAMNLPESIGNVNETQGCDKIENNAVASSNRRAVDLMDEESDEHENAERNRLLCKICFMNNWSKLLYPCGHVACTNCANNIVHCAFCRKHISDRVQMYVE